MNKIKLMDLKEIIKLPLSKDVDLNNMIIDNDDGTVNFTIDTKSLQLAIDNFMKSGNLYRSGYPVWLYDTTNVKSSFFNPLRDEEVLAEVISFSIEDDSLFAEVLPIEQEEWNKVSKLKHLLAYEPIFNHRTKVMGFKRINGIVKVLTIQDIELKEGSDVMVISRKGITNDVICKVELIDGDKRYKVGHNWFKSDGLLVNGRGIRIKHLDGQEL